MYDDKIDAYLDKNIQNISYLSNEDIDIRDEVVSAIGYHDRKNYSLISYCIMPNHVHLIINPFNFKYTELGKILGSIKKYSARKANVILKREGQFWQNESYDHIIRSRNELAIKIDYVKNNSVYARLVSAWEEWSGTFVNKKYI